MRAIAGRLSIICGGSRPGSAALIVAAAVGVRRGGHEIIMRILFEVYGRQVLVVGKHGEWSVYYPGPDGKRRRALEIVIPPDVSESKLERYLADLCHEWASERYPDVRRLD